MFVCAYFLAGLSSERNFCVRLNKHFVPEYPIEVPDFTGNHADLLVLVSRCCVLLRASLLYIGHTQCHDKYKSAPDVLVLVFPLNHRKQLGYLLSKKFDQYLQSRHSSRPSV